MTFLTFLFRHASIKFQEHSQRYSDKVVFESIELRKEDKVNRQSSTEIFNPLVWTADKQRECEANEAVLEVLNQIEDLYKNLINAEVAKECARMILPECTQSTLSANGTLRSWLSFLNVRLDHHAQKECQEIAEQIGLALEKELPNVFGNINWKTGMFL